MKFKIVHESRGRVRIQVMQKRMTLEQADLLEAYLNHSPPFGRRRYMNGRAAR